MSGVVIELNHVSKKFPLRKDSSGLKEYAVRLHRLIKEKRNPNRSFLALNDLTFKIGREECVGIIGRNGAGKSTLLSLMLGTILPTTGSIRVTERVTPLLELGAGLHPDLTGRENILLNGILLGLTRTEVMSKMSSIIDFSGLDGFIDVPLRTYSSGMFLRLAFSVAIHADPKILIIDEILSVGDEEFQKKSKETLLNLIRGDVTTIIVSHDLTAIQGICSRALWLDHGALIADGDPGTVISKYREGLSSRA